MKHLRILTAALALASALPTWAAEPVYDATVLKEYRDFPDPALAWPAQALPITITQEERMVDGYPARMLVGTLPEMNLLMNLDASRAPVVIQPASGKWSWQLSLPSFPTSRVRVAAFPAEKLVRGDQLGTLLAHAKAIVTEAGNSPLAILNGPMDGKVETATVFGMHAQLFEYGFLDSPEGSQLQRVVTDYIMLEDRTVFLVRLESTADRYDAFRRIMIGVMRSIYFEHPEGYQPLTTEERAELYNEKKWLD